MSRQNASASIESIAYFKEIGQWFWALSQNQTSNFYLNTVWSLLPEPHFLGIIFWDPLYLKTFGVKKGQCCSAATLLSSATRQVFWRTTETSFPGEMRRQRNTCGNQDRWWFKRFREGCAWLSAILSLTCMLHETGQKVSEPMLFPQWFPGCAIVLNDFLSAENAGFGRIQ